MLNDSEIHGAVLSTLADLLEDASGEHPELTGREALFDLDLNSLDLARLIIVLEAAVGTCPFRDGGRTIADISSVDDLVAAYAVAVAAARGAAAEPVGEPA